jgi:hypothetical protein
MIISYRLISSLDACGWLTRLLLAVLLVLLVLVLGSRMAEHSDAQLGNQSMFYARVLIGVQHCTCGPAPAHT